MKFFKKIALLALACLTCFTLGLVCSCGGNDSSTSSTPEQAPAEYVYNVRVQSEGGFGIRGVGVSLYNGKNKIASKTTSSEGNAYFTKDDVAIAGEYDIRFSEFPDGWSLKENVSYKTSAQEKTD